MAEKHAHMLVPHVGFQRVEVVFCGKRVCPETMPERILFLVPVYPCFPADAGGFVSPAGRGELALALVGWDRLDPRGKGGVDSDIAAGGFLRHFRANADIVKFKRNVLP